MRWYRSCSLLSAALVAFAEHLPSTLNFDDLKPQPPFNLPVYDPPNPYHELSLTAFSVFDPQSPRLEGIILEDDRNCATSRPNALLGSRIGGEDGTKPSLSIPVSKNGSSFDLVSFMVKPLTAPPGQEQITLWVEAQRTAGMTANSGEDESLIWHVEFPVGYPLNFAASMPDHWRKLQKVEMWAQYGPGKLDWEFCVDDIVVRINGDDTARNARQLELR